MHTDQVVSQRYRPGVFGDRGHGEDVAERFRHLLAGHGHPMRMHPVPRESAAGAMRLCGLILMMWKDQIQPTAMDVEIPAEIGASHRRALNVPAGPARAPRRGP